MDSTGVKDSGSVPCPVTHRVEGQAIITISDFSCKTMSRQRASMRYYVGEVKCDAGIVQSQGIKSTILFFEGDVAKQIHDCLKCISHPNVMRCFGHGSGIGGHSKYKFLSLPFFDTTFEEYLQDKESCVQMGRFTEELISLITDIIKALLALHNAGFCCSKLKARDIAILKQHNSKTARIWNSKSVLQAEKDLDWQRLCKLLKLTSLWSDEAEDLYQDILRGSLKGLDILRHCALLTVRKKFDNVLIFYFYMEVYWTKDGSQGIVEAPEWLDDKFSWKSERAVWIQTASLSDPPDTYRGFAKSLRHLVEHEVDFLTPELTNIITFKEREVGRKEVDLEWQIRKSWSQAFLKLQKFVIKNNLTY